MPEIKDEPIIRLLKETDIFSEVPSSVLLDCIPQLQVIHFKEGENIIRKGDSGDCMFLLMSGEVRVHDENFTVASLGVGKYFGEMSLLQTIPRSMSVSAKTSVEVISITQQSFYKILSNHPSLIQKVVGELVDRLNKQNNSMVDELKTRKLELKKEVEIQTALYKEQKERAEQSEQFEQQFLANMSHEIRTPMNAVMGMTNLVMDTSLNAKQKFYLEGIKKSSDHLLHIINDILDLSKIEAGKMELEKIDFSLPSLVEQVQQTLQYKADEKGLELIIDLGATLSPVLLGDPVRLKQVLINLAGNAIKFTEKGSVVIQVILEGQGNRTRFSIIDTGIGIPQDKLQTVFENFTQANTSDTRKHGGTGLGLTISRQLVELMGGKISIASEVGNGTTFSFTLDFEEGSAERLEQRLSEENEVDGSILDELSILIVDDNEYNRIVAQDTLESKSKAKIIAVSGAHEAIKLLGEKQFDVILMDAQMPVMNGFEATQYIRTQFAAPLKNIPIIALTASVLRTDLEKCKAAGMDWYIPKPFKASQLILGIAQTLKIKPKTKTHTDKEINKPVQFFKGLTDLDYLNKFCEGDKVRMKKYMELFSSNVPVLIKKVRAALAKNDSEEIANQIHGFKTNLTMMGMNSSKVLAVRVENQCRQGNLDHSTKEDVLMLIKEIEDATKELA